MKTFDIFIHPESKKVRVVKRGFSWPAFFFTVPWCFIKGMWIRGLLLVVIVYLMMMGFSILAAQSNPEHVSLLADLVLLIFSLVVGSYGNEWRAASLRKAGYAHKGNIETDSVKTALAEFTQA